MLIKKCNDRNIIKKSPESAIATFLAMDDFNNVDFAIRNWNKIYKSCAKIKQLVMNYNLFVTIYNKSKVCQLITINTYKRPILAYYYY